MADEMLVIGPSGTGKTVLLGSLLHASLLRGTGDGRRVRILNRGEKSLALAHAHSAMAESGRPELQGTGEVHQIAFDLEDAWCRWPFEWLPRPLGTRTRFEVLDGPGGAIFFHSPNPERHRMLHAARDARGFLLCVDGSEPDGAVAVFRGLIDFLQRIGADVLRYRRVAICLTKADLVFMPHGRSAQEEATLADPREAARELLTTAALNALRQFGRRTEIGACWVSAYGFIPGEGIANYDPGNDGILTRRPGTRELHGAAGIDAWIPFQVLDPFVWLATGRRGGVRVFERGWFER